MSQTNFGELMIRRRETGKYTQQFYHQILRGKDCFLEDFELVGQLIDVCFIETLVPCIEAN